MRRVLKVSPARRVRKESRVLLVLRALKVVKGLKVLRVSPVRRARKE